MKTILPAFHGENAVGYPPENSRMLFPWGASLPFKVELESEGVPLFPENTEHSRRLRELWAIYILVRNTDNVDLKRNSYYVLARRVFCRQQSDSMSGPSVLRETHVFASLSYVQCSEKNKKVNIKVEIFF